MGKRFLLLLAVVLSVLAFVPALAAASLVNEYGLHYAGQQKCVDCHELLGPSKVGLHSRFASPGVQPGAPEGWTAFSSAGGQGESYDIAGNTWLTLGDVLGNSATEYLFWNGTADATVMPWNIVEGLAWEPHEGWVASEEGLFDEPYACQRCHQLGSTVPGTGAVPNPAATSQPTATTARQWARDESKSVADFMSDPTVSYAGLGIQCENCHGTGEAASGTEDHANTLVKVNSTLDILGQSQVCGQCHGSFTNVAGTMGIYGYTANLPLRDFVDINGASGGQSYTKIPTVEEFLATPTAYWMFPNGSNAKGNHYYYNEWAASGHSYRGAYYNTDPAAMGPDVFAFQKSGHGHYNATTQSSIDSKCYQCHTGEGYLSSKDAKVAEGFVPTASNTGFLGQECAACHQGHPSAIGAEDVVREPDKAGERSAVGLTADNASICEDCHNWQFEVQGTSPAYRPIAALTSRGGPSHPQRETVHGRVMVDVPAAGEFMPGATCEDCHMPKTNRNANRISHGMKPMLPGDAETWMTAAGASYMGEDSCSKCHGGETRSQLQANIDTWQGEAAAAAADAGAAITAAQADPAFPLTDPTSPDYMLAGRATWNYKAYVNDASGGVHNPEYIVAGLMKAEKMAKSIGGSFSAVFASKSVTPGGTGFITGKVVNGDKSGAAGAALVLYANGAATTATTVSDAQGAFAFMITPDAATTYKVVWQRSGVAATDLASANVAVSIAKMASTTTIARSASTITLGKSVKLTGKVTPAATGSVKVQYRRAGGSWKSLAAVSLSGSSTYSKTYKPSGKGTWYCRALYGGSATVASSKSVSVKLVVK
jgi:hypothetical protein